MCEASFFYTCRLAAEEGRFEDAADAYEEAEDWEACVRLYLGSLADVERAKLLTRQHGLAPAAAAVAKHCLINGDYPVRENRFELYLPLCVEMK